MSINLVSLLSQCVWNINQQQNRGKQTKKSRNAFSGDGRVSRKHYKNPIPGVSQPFFLLSRRDCLPQKSIKQATRHTQSEKKQKEIERKTERKEDRRNKDSQTDKKIDRWQLDK